jgi:hypothetical protein
VPHLPENCCNDVNNLGFEIQSEQTLEKKRKSPRPDISIWDGSKLLAVIECKTQLGWQRHTWESNFKDRKSNIHAKVFLVVMTDCNWGGFGNNPGVGTEYFCLLKSDKYTWPTELPINYDDSCLENRIELLFEQLRNLR